MNAIVRNSISNRNDIPVICRETLKCIGTLDGSLEALSVLADKTVEQFVNAKRTSMPFLKNGMAVRVDDKSCGDKRKGSDSVDIERPKEKKGRNGKKNIEKEKDSKSNEQKLQEQIGTHKDLIENISARKVTLATRAYDFLDHAVKCVDEDIRMIERAMKLNGYDIPISDDSDVNNISIVGKKKELEPVYCTCRNIAHGDMISCDNEKCNIEWFHFACVGLTKLPKGDWFCKVCKANLRNRL